MFCARIYLCMILSPITATQHVIMHEFSDCSCVYNGKFTDTTLKVTFTIVNRIIHGLKACLQNNRTHYYLLSRFMQNRYIPYHVPIVFLRNQQIAEWVHTLSRAYCIFA